MTVIIDDDNRDHGYDEDPYLFHIRLTMMGHGHDDPYLFHIRFKSPVIADWRCRGCVVIIIIMTVGDAEDA